MTTVSLQDWLKFGWVRTHRTSQQEIADLLAVADRDLEACQTTGLVADWRFNIAYNAALQLAAAALAASGYQAERSNHHFRVIQSLEFTVGAAAKTMSELEAEEMRSLAVSLRSSVRAWIAKNYPEYAP